MWRQLQVWRIEKFELVEVPEGKHGQFSAGDCYMVLYTYGVRAPQHLVYFWQGADCSLDERGACAACAVQVDQQHCGGSAVQARLSPLPAPPPPAYLAPVATQFSSSSCPDACALRQR
jgi:hypothetical protein